MRWFKGFGGLLVLMLLATGCFKIEAEISVDDDGSGSVEMLSAIDREGVFSVLEDFDMPADEVGTEAEFCDEFTSEMTPGDDGLPANATVEDYDQDGFCGATVSYTLDASTDHSQAIEPLFDGGDARLFKQGENWIFEANLDLSDLDDGTGDIPPAMADALFGDASMKFVVDLPGSAIDGQNNATSVDGGRFEWDIDIDDPPARMFAQTAPGSGGGGGLGLILVIVAVLALLAAAAWWFLTQRSKGDAGLATAGAGAAPGPMAAPAAGAAMPASPPVADTPPAPSDPVTPVKPTNPTVQETVVMGAADAEALADGTAADAVAEPVWDESLNAWVIDDPVQGKLVHDTSTDTWKPA